MTGKSYFKLLWGNKSVILTVQRQTSSSTAFEIFLISAGKWNNSNSQSVVNVDQKTHFAKWDSFMGNHVKSWEALKKTT